MSQNNTATTVKFVSANFTLLSITGVSLPTSGKYVFQPNTGDGTVPDFSAFPDGGAGNDGSDPTINFNGIKNVTGEPQYGADFTHTGMFSLTRINQLVVQNLGSSISPGNVATGLELGSASALGTAYYTTLGAGSVLGFDIDPVQGFLVDAKGKRLGYSTATGAVTEIPGSQWYGGENGFGIIVGAVAQPVHVALIGAGGSYYVSVQGYEGNTTVSVQSSGSLASGSQLSVALPFQVIPQPTVSSVKLNYGPPAGGTLVTITGTNLTDVVKVMFGTTPATTFSVNSPTQMTAVAPAGAVGCR